MNVKRLFRAGVRYVFNSNYRFLLNCGRGMYDDMSDEEYIKRKFKAIMKKELDLENPRTFSEKLQWLKLYDRKPEYTMMVDKYLVREYVANTIGEEYLIPLLAVWDDADKIDFSTLPDRFVLKCNHNSGLGMYICRDKSKLNEKRVREGLRRGLQQDYYLTGREWPYRDVPRRITAEVFLEDDECDEIRDYKFFCFDGEPLFCQVISDRSTDERMDFFDMAWERSPLSRARGSGLAYPTADRPIPMPKTFETMKKAAATLSCGLPFLRVDFYEVNGKMYFGELTFFPASGFCPFTPDEWNERLGDRIPIDALKEQARVPSEEDLT